MSKIFQIIPSQNWEIVRDVIAQILAIEIQAQYVLGGEDLLNNVDVWVERFVPFNESELPSLSVSVNDVLHVSHDQREMVYEATYNIDAYVSANTDVLNNADNLSQVNLQRLLGVCWAILSNPVYDNLGFERTIPRIFGTTVVESIGFPVKEPGDMNSICMGRIQYKVNMTNSLQLLDGIPLDQSDTVIKLDSTEKGYKYTV